MRDGKFHVLLVDDEEDLLEICADAFRMENFFVSEATSGAFALDIYSHKHPEIDVIITDSSMPQMTGDQLLTHVKKVYEMSEQSKCANSKFPLFYFSTGHVNVDEKSLVAKGAAGVILKPYDIDEMIAKIRKGLSSRINS